MIEARYNLLSVVETCIEYNLDIEEMVSAIMSEVNFERTTNVEMILAIVTARIYFKILNSTKRED